MQINIPQPEQDRLVQHAAAAGYDDVERYATEHLLALAHQPLPLSPAELQASVARCEKANAEMEAGGGRDAREALLEVGEELGFKPPK